MIFGLGRILRKVGSIPLYIDKSHLCQVFLFINPKLELLIFYWISLNLSMTFSISSGIVALNSQYFPRSGWINPMDSAWSICLFIKGKVMSQMSEIVSSQVFTNRLELALLKPAVWALIGMVFRVGSAVRECVILAVWYGEAWMEHPMNPKECSLVLLRAVQDIFIRANDTRRTVIKNDAIARSGLCRDYQSDSVKKWPTLIRPDNALGPPFSPQMIMPWCKQRVLMVMGLHGMGGGVHETVMVRTPEASHDDCFSSFGLTKIP